ncbi:MAG: class II fructose-bisphosphate aldolase [Clostridiales bacterium]|nr:class II fructose-bisphosphate aldolase [Clostridiales bacterium]
MPLTTTQEMLAAAQAGGYAVGAFNVENMEMIQAVVEAAEELRAPVIVQTVSASTRYGSLALYYANVAALARQASVPVALHLDHGDGYDLALRAIRAGYTSVMIDGSQEPYESNVDLSGRVVQAARPCGVPVEAELGQVGGQEDDVDGGAGRYTDPAQASDFVARTGVSSLAVAIGTAHGVYKGEPKLDLDRLAQIRAAVHVPLVLHGASGVPYDSLQASIRAGICKVNFATELRMAYSNGIKDLLREQPDAFDPKLYGSRGRDFVREVVRERIVICGSDGKA